MKKPEILRDLLFASVPTLAKKRENLSMFIDKGRIAARATGSLSFEYRYTLSIVVQDYAGDLDDLVVPILAWIAEYQPDLMERGEQEPFSFESEILDSDAADVEIGIELTERVKVERRDTGGTRVTHLPEPPRTDAFAGIGHVNLWQVVLDDMVAGTVETTRA
ncbi:phage tail protein [Sphingomonas sp. Leaf38]|uniref:phage tail protein n=1 Tax=Sphingomonas sp. Leaf38 TaxID=1736217 RepID=UPI0006FEC506|nr:phage tail protein [Sphingomonas sp. Leaf38]KQN29709.1 phage tail protein [Sphingomonas sp. Leaf38]